MIKLKSIGYQQDNVAAQVEYDLDGETHSFTLYAKRRIVATMTLDEVKNYIRSKVESERDTKLNDAVEALLNALIDVDIEEN